MEAMMGDKMSRRSGGFTGTSYGGKIQFVEAIMVGQLILHKHVARGAVA